MACPRRPHLLPQACRQARVAAFLPRSPHEQSWGLSCPHLCPEVPCVRPVPFVFSIQAPWQGWWASLPGEPQTEASVSSASLPLGAGGLGQLTAAPHEATAVGGQDHPGADATGTSPAPVLLPGGAAAPTAVAV